MASDKFYLNWQEKISSNKTLRMVLVFFAIYAVAFIALLWAYIYFLGGGDVVILSILAFILARFIISPLIYSVYKKQRPYQKLNFDAPYSLLLSRRTEKWNAFPSDHALSFVSIATPLFYFYPYAACLILGLGVFNSWARVALGYHDEIDILGGWIVGLISGIFVVSFLAPLLFTH